MSKNDDKYTCVYCRCEFESFDKNIVICDKCGSPYHKDCWDENKKCSIYGCNSTTAHSPVGPLPKTKPTQIIPQPSPRPIIVVPQTPQPQQKEINPLLWLGIIIGIIIIGAIISLDLQNRKFNTYIIADNDIQLPLNETNRFHWNVEKHFDEIAENNIHIKNNNKDLFKIDGKKDLNIITNNKQGTGSFTISVDDKRLNIKKYKVKVNVSDSVNSQINLSQHPKKIKYGNQTEIVITAPSNTSIEKSKFDFNVNKKYSSGDVEIKTSYDEFQNVDNKLKITINGTKLGKVNCTINVKVLGQSSPISENLQFDVIE